MLELVLSDTSSAELNRKKHCEVSQQRKQHRYLGTRITHGEVTVPEQRKVHNNLWSTSPSAVLAQNAAADSPTAVC